MKKSIKILLSIIITLVISLNFVSCGDLFTSVGTGGGQSNSIPKTDGSQMNFEIKVTNSLDIVPEGVAVLDYIRPSVV